MRCAVVKAQAVYGLTLFGFTRGHAVFVNNIENFHIFTFNWHYIPLSVKIEQKNAVPNKNMLFFEKTVL